MLVKFIINLNSIYTDKSNLLRFFYNIFIIFNFRDLLSNDLRYFKKSIKDVI